MTDKYAVFGNPIAHSKSPKLHQYFASLCNQDISYEPILVPDNSFDLVIKEFFKQGGKGCNITVPCKLDAYRFANKLTPYALAAGAVNTLKLEADGSILGDNTDGRGLVFDLKRQNAPLNGKILIIGAGGATQGILKPILDEKPQSLTIVNRTVAKAIALQEQYEGILASSFDKLQGEFDLIINASSSSLYKELPNISDEILAKAKFVYDLMYQDDGSTIFTKKAQSIGVEKCSDGFGMLIGQALLSFELWRGVKPDFNQVIEYFRHA